MITLITGASSGIGRAMALNFAKRGYNLILVARREERLVELKKEIAQFSNVRVKTICKDVSKVEECIDLHKMVQGVKIDVLVNNAGFGLYGKFTETSLETELNMIDVNIKAVHVLTKLFLQDFVKRDHGYLLNVASVAGYMAGPMQSTYYATKSYVIQLTKAIYEELRQAKSKVSVSVLCPGPVHTDFNKVAGANFAEGGTSPEDLAEYAINGLFNHKLEIIPKAKIKATAMAARLVPSKAMLWGAYSVQKARGGDCESTSEPNEMPVAEIEEIDFDELFDTNNEE